MGVNEESRSDALRALLNLAVMEGLVLIVVVSVYFTTHEVAHLVAGVVATSLIFGPMTYRWYKEHGSALKRDGAVDG